MALSLIQIEQEAEKIRHKINSGELVEGCCMSTIQTPVTEAWDVALELTEGVELTSAQKQELFLTLDMRTQSQLEATDYNDFDLVYEYLLRSGKPD